MPRRLPGLRCARCLASEPTPHSSTTEKFSSSFLSEPVAQRHQHFPVVHASPEYDIRVLHPRIAAVEQFDGNIEPVIRRTHQVRGTDDDFISIAAQEIG